MSAFQDPFNAKRAFRSGHLYSLPALEEAGLGKISRLPACIRIVLESLLRNCDGQRVTPEDVKALCAWNPTAPAKREVPFVVSRVVLQDFTGVPLLVDLAAMRQAVADLGKDPALIEPLVPVDLVVDHSVQVDRYRTATAFEENLKIEFERNHERYEFLKWGQQAFQTFSVVPPGAGIVHQVNLEYLARLVFDEKGIFYPDTLVGTDSHTTMINGLGIVGWGVGGIEAEAAMLGQPVAFQTPEVIGVNLTGALREGVTATDLVLRVTELLRAEKVVGKFVEFFGEGAASLTLADRATIGNMAPEYGATMGYFPIDEKSLDYLAMTGRPQAQIDLIRDYYTAQGLFGVPREGEVDYSRVLNLDLDTIVPSVAGPKRPQDRIDLPLLKSEFEDLLARTTSEDGYGVAPDQRHRRVPVHTADLAVAQSGGATDLSTQTQGWSEREMVTNRPATTASPKPEVPLADGSTEVSHGSVLIAAITSCTNTSNPSVMLGAGLVAKKAVEKGLSVNPLVKTSLAPGSRVVTDYLNASGLQTYLDQLGFNLVGYGCTTCIGNSGPLDPSIEAAIKEGDLVTASVLSGNRNFEARIHGAIKANFLMSPPLVVAFALAGRVDIDLDTEPLGTGNDGQPVYLKDIWPTQEEIQQLLVSSIQPEMFKQQYSRVYEANEEWDKIDAPTGTLYQWKEDSTYIQQPPFFDDFTMDPSTLSDTSGMRPLLILGESVTTDHISPAGAIPPDGPAGKYLQANGVEPQQFNSFGSRRGNDRVMTRGTFANVRIKNRLADGKEGGYTKLMPEGTPTTVYEASQTYKERKTPLIVFGGGDYGMGSSRDWAAKGTLLLGVKAVVATSFERIHRSNLIGMGVLPLQFKDGESVDALGLDGSETYDLTGVGDGLQPGEDITLRIQRDNGETQEITLCCRIDTAIEAEYYRHGGILQYVLRQILGGS